MSHLLTTVSGDFGAVTWNKRNWCDLLPAPAPRKEAGERFAGRKVLPGHGAKAFPIRWEMGARDTMVTWIAGATGELGRALVAGFLGRGDRVVGLGRSPAADAEEEGYRYLDGDLASSEGVKALTDRAQAFGPVENLVVAVGAWSGGTPVHEVAPREWEAMLEANLTVPFRLMRAAMGIMVQRRRGRVVTVGSLSAMDAAPGQGAYNAAKAGLLALTRTVAAEGARSGICAACLLPATIDTAANRRAMATADPAGWVDPAALVDLALFLTGPHGAQLNGAALTVAGPPAASRS